LQAGVLPAGATGSADWDAAAGNGSAADCDTGATDWYFAAGDGACEECKLRLKKKEMHICASLHI